MSYLDLQYGGAANVLPNPAPGVLPHLKTLAVLPENVQNGTGSALMYVVLEEYTKLNWRSKPDRIANEILYKKFAKAGNPFFNQEGIEYLPYYVCHTIKEKHKALDWMKKQPDSFIQKPEPQHLLTS